MPSPLEIFPYKHLLHRIFLLKFSQLVSSPQLWFMWNTFHGFMCFSTGFPVGSRFPGNRGSVLRWNLLLGAGLVTAFRAINIIVSHWAQPSMPSHYDELFSLKPWARISSQVFGHRGQESHFCSVTIDEVYLHIWSYASPFSFTLRSLNFSAEFPVWFVLFHQIKFSLLRPISISLLKIF